MIHGQWDWMNDPDIHSSTWEWDTASAADWNHSHNVMHHTFTNVRQGQLTSATRSCASATGSPWRPAYLLQPIYNPLLTALFQWGVAMHDVDPGALAPGRKIHSPTCGARSPASAEGDQRAPQGLRPVATARRSVGLSSVLRRQRDGEPHPQPVVVRDHLLRPLPRRRPRVHRAEIEGETRAPWYRRQVLGSCNIEGGPLFHMMSGNLSYQIEHHLFPDLPSNRYPAAAPRVKGTARSTASRTTAARSCSSWGWCSGRSCASLSRAVGRARSLGPTAAEGSL